MKLDKKLPNTDLENEEKLPSETVDNAHASGDGTIERSEEDDLAKAKKNTGKNEPPY